LSTRDTAIKAATSVARDLAEGRVKPDDLERRALEECRALFGKVAGPDDPLWPLHVDIARQVLALDGIPFNELSEWVGIARHRKSADPPAGGGDSKAGYRRTG
jgi:hypothetical protein